MTFDELVAALRKVEGLRDKGKVHPNFHFRSKRFLHFHSADGVAYAHVRFGDDFEHVAAATDAERRVLFDRVAEHVAATRRS